MLLEDATLASLPIEALAALAPLRCHPGLTVLQTADRLWLHWPQGDGVVLRLVLPLAGVELFIKRGEHWYRFGHYLPAWEVPDLEEARPLQHVLFPAPFQAVPPSATNLARVTLTLVPTTQVHPTTAVLASLVEWLRWADTVPAFRLHRLQAALCGKQVLVRGDRLPLLLESHRYWGDIVLIPLGQRLEPDLGEPILRQALLLEEEVLVCDAEGTERIPFIAFGPLSRGALRRALQENVS